MTIRTILAAISGGIASEGASETACGLAQLFGAHVEGLHVRADLADVLPLFGINVGVPMYGDLLRLVEEQVAESAGRAKAAFAAAISYHSLPERARPVGTDSAVAGVSAAWREEMGFASTVVARRSRYFDLVVLGRSGASSTRATATRSSRRSLKRGGPSSSLPCASVRRLAILSPSPGTSRRARCPSCNEHGAYTSSAPGRPLNRMMSWPSISPGMASTPPRIR